MPAAAGADGRRRYGIAAVSARLARDQ